MMPSALSNFWSSTRRLSYDDDADDDGYRESETSQLVNTFFINLVFFGALVACFEIVRRKKSIYANRCTKRFQSMNRVPERPSHYPLAWIPQIMQISENETLAMVGLDGYMCLRYIILCFKLGCFLSFWGLVVLVPIYQHGTSNDVKLSGWDKYTLANIPDDPDAYRLWAPVVFSYLFAGFFCQLLYYEYKHFVHKRVQYLVHGDNDTHPQTYYTVMIERVPAAIRSAPMLTDFFERLFPGDVFCVELAVDLMELEEVAKKREQVRDRLEKSVALCWARMHRPSAWVALNFYSSNLSPQRPRPLREAWAEALEAEDEEGKLVLSQSSGVGGCLAAAAALVGVEAYDAIDHYFFLLHALNGEVQRLQREVIAQRQRVDELEELRLLKLKNELQGRTIGALSNMGSTFSDLLKQSSKHSKKLISSATSASMSIASSSGNALRRRKGNSSSGKGILDSADTKEQLLVLSDTLQPMRAASDEAADIEEEVPVREDVESKEGDYRHLSTVSASAAIDVESPNDVGSILQSRHPFEGGAESCASIAGNTDITPGKAKDLPPMTPSERTLKKSRGRHASNMVASGAEVGGLVGSAARSGMLGVAREGAKMSEFAAKGAVRGVLEATRALEMLTFGAYYRVSSTAFVTFRSRVSKSSSHQMLLSHEFYRMQVTPAPNPKDIIWENVSIFQGQIDIRRSIADGTLMVGAVFWSIVVTFIFTVSNLESISHEVPAIQAYSDTQAYQFLNNYLAIGVLLILLSCLPLLFDFISRNYEGLKLESEIQNSIMTRYFYYQLANVYVSVGLGSIASSLHSILKSPESILTILGASLPSFSVYFANLIIIKTFTAVPLEMLRVLPLLEILSVQLCQDRRKCTRRDLRTGAFADPPMLYGWIYPNLLMVLMIMLTYACISPFLTPLCTLFFALAFLMYKYQLLFVYINDYQAGGYMWFAVFSRSMVALLGGVLTLLCYLAIRLTFISGPFYLLLPLPFLICLFWRYCETNIKAPCQNLSLERAKELDHATSEARDAGLPTPQTAFRRTLFRQPALAAGKLKPALYRKGKPFLPPGLDAVCVPSSDDEEEGAGAGGTPGESSQIQSRGVYFESSSVPALGLEHAEESPAGTPLVSLPDSGPTGSSVAEGTALGPGRPAAGPSGGVPGRRRPMSLGVVARSLFAWKKAPAPQGSSSASGSPRDQTHAPGDGPGVREAAGCGRRTQRALRADEVDTDIFTASAAADAAVSTATGEGGGFGESPATMRSQLADGTGAQLGVGMGMGGGTDMGAHEAAIEEEMNLLLEGGDSDRRNRGGGWLSHAHLPHHSSFSTAHAKNPDSRASATRAAGPGAGVVTTDVESGQRFSTRDRDSVESGPDIQRSSHKLRPLASRIEATGNAAAINEEHSPIAHIGQQGNSSEGGKYGSTGQT